MRYDPKFAARARSLAERGYAISEIANALDVPIFVISKWREVHSEFGQAIMAGQAFFNKRVAANMKRLLAEMERAR